MKRQQHALPVMLISLSLVVFFGCEDKTAKEQAETEAFAQRAFGDVDGGNPFPDSTPSSTPSSALPSAPVKENLPDDKDLLEHVKRGLNKGPFAEMPLEIAELTVNWTDKSANAASGKFSVKTNTTETLYKPVEHKDALKKLAVTELYEGEVNDAQDKIWKLPEPHKTNLRNAVPEGRLDRFRFFDVLVPKGGEVALTGSVEMNKYGDDWQVDAIRGNTISCGNPFFPESELRDASKLDDPKTKEAVAAIIRERKEFVEKVDSTIAGLNEKYQAALKKQKDDFDKYCKPGKKYEGSFKHKTTNGAVRIVFEEYATADKNTVKGTISYLGYPHIKYDFTVAVNTREVAAYPVTGKTIPPYKDSIHHILRRHFKLTGKEPDYGVLVDMYDKNVIGIRFTDTMEFSVSLYSSMSSSVLFTLTE